MSAVNGDSESDVNEIEVCWSITRLNFIIFRRV